MDTKEAREEVLFDLLEAISDSRGNEVLSLKWGVINPLLECDTNEEGNNA